MNERPQPTSTAASATVPLRLVGPLVDVLVLVEDDSPAVLFLGVLPLAAVVFSGTRRHRGWRWIASRPRQCFASASAAPAKEELPADDDDLEFDPDHAVDQQCPAA